MAGRGPPDFLLVDEYVGRMRFADPAPLCFGLGPQGPHVLPPCLESSSSPRQGGSSWEPVTIYTHKRGMPWKCPALPRKSLLGEQGCGKSSQGARVVLCSGGGRGEMGREQGQEAEGCPVSLTGEVII